MPASAAETFQQFRVPQESGRALIVPPLNGIGTTIQPLDAAQVFNGLEFCGERISDIRQMARREAVELARRFTLRYRNLPAQFSGFSDATPLILAGHQPELFHPGVWFKNFLLSQLAKDNFGVAINFLVDNDLCRGTSIRVPARGPDGSVVASTVAFDTPHENVPWEQRLLLDHACWCQFPTVVRQALLPEIERPLVADLWKYACEGVARTGHIGLALAEARHSLEQEMGLQTLEVPLSHLASTRAFALFSIQLLSELPRLHAIYNSQRKNYRAAHRIRSQAHPVPALEQQHDWLEAPWWVYSSHAPQRQRLWVQLSDNRLTLSDRAGWQKSILGKLERDQAAAQWLDLLSEGVCLRPRALLTTMYLRLIVSDAFIHGIGGGKYDQLTDAIVQEFFGIKPPSVIVASATLRLHSRTTSAPKTSSQRQREKLWQLKNHPEYALMSEPDSAEATALATRKRELLANMPPRGAKWEWHHEMTSVNRRLLELAAGQVTDTQQQLDASTVEERQQRILASRELSFCLFDREFIAAELQRMAVAL